jgi:tetrahydromethanopterin S-methyltransferase subunit C
VPAAWQQRRADSSAIRGLQPGSMVERLHASSIATAVAAVEQCRVVAAEGLATGSASVGEPPLLAQVVHRARTVENADATAGRAVGAVVAVVVAGMEAAEGRQARCGGGAGQWD